MGPPLSLSVVSTINSDTFLQKAAELATKLKVPFCPLLEENQSELALAYTAKGLQLLQLPFGSTKRTCLLFVDFVHGKNGFRLAKNCTIKQPIARAIGIKPNYRPTVLDATAGLGSDSFVLASLGCQVTMCERSPILSSLLQDGLERAATDMKTSDIVKNRMTLIEEDSAKYLQNSKRSYNTIYLDPMYPHRKGAALNKKVMRTIRQLVGEDQDGSILLEMALKNATNRVVVKRPRHAPLLNGTPPSHIISMKSSRFDIYMTFNS